MTGIKLTFTIGAAALLLAACSSSATSGNTSTNTTATHSAAAQPPAAAASSAPAAAAAPLSGPWHGQYGGSYQGTFVIHWRQSGSKLGGHIHISNPASTLPIHGSVAGGSIQFGTVGSYVITYSGTVSGHSMSGTYKVGGAQGGNWSASKR
jgi:ABC-type phosphate transport system substrate-binding protein